MTKSDDLIKVLTPFSLAAWQFTIATPDGQHDIRQALAICCLDEWDLIEADRLLTRLKEEQADRPVDDRDVLPEEV